MDCASTSALHQVCELNEDAIFELSSGHPGPAIVLLEEAAGQLMQCLTADSHSSSAISPHYTSRVQIPHLHDDLFYVYSCAVSYSASTTTASTTTTTTTTIPSQSDMIFELAIVLFNLALAHHQQGILTKAEAPLKQALTFYKECHQALQSLTTDHNDDVLVLTLAVLNNQAEILYYHQQQQHEHEHSTEIFQKLMTHSMHAILQQADDTSNLSMVEQSQIHEFVQNAMVLRLERPCAAPSA